MTPTTTATPRLRGSAQQKLLAFASLIVLVVGFSLASPNFFQVANIMSILQAASVNGVLAIGVTLIIITGGIDLSIGTLMTFCAVMTGVVLTWAGMPLILGVVTAIGTGALCGLISGTLVAKAKIPPFIATLGMMLVLKGLSLIVTGTKPIYFNATPGFTQIAQGSLIGRVLQGFPVPNGVLILFSSPPPRRGSCRAPCSGATPSRWGRTKRPCASRGSAPTRGRWRSMRSRAASLGSPGC